MQNDSESLALNFFFNSHPTSPKPSSCIIKILHNASPTSYLFTKLISLLHEAKEVIWWSHLFEKMKFDPGHDLVILNDNLQTIRLMNSKIARIDTKLKHIDISQCWLRQMIQSGHIKVDYLPTNQMIADGMIKLLPSQKQKDFIKHLGMVNVKYLMSDQSE